MSGNFDFQAELLEIPVKQLSVFFEMIKPERDELVFCLEHLIDRWGATSRVADCRHLVMAARAAHVHLERLASSRPDWHIEVELAALREAFCRVEDRLSEKQVSPALMAGFEHFCNCLKQLTNCFKEATNSSTSLE